MPYRKIINDPVYGFITIDDELILQDHCTSLLSAAAAHPPNGNGALGLPGCCAYKAASFTGRLSFNVQCVQRIKK